MSKTHFPFPSLTIITRKSLAHKFIYTPHTLAGKIDKIHKVFSRRLSQKLRETICQTLFETTPKIGKGDEKFTLTRCVQQKRIKLRSEEKFIGKAPLNNSTNKEEAGKTSKECTEDTASE